MSLTLTKDELAELTGRKRSPAQARALRAMGIDHFTRPDGTVAVLREALQAPLASANVRERRAEIDWDE